MRILISSVVDLKRSAHNRLHEFVRHLSREHQVTILSIRDWWKSRQTDVSLYDQGFEDMWQRVDVRYFTDMRISPIVQELFSVLTIGNLLRQVGGSFDVHFNYNTLISGLFVAAKMRTAGVGTVYDLADDLPAMISTSPQISPALRPLGGALARLMVRCNLMVSKKVTLTTEALGLPRSFQSKYVLLPNGVDTTLFRKRDGSALREQLGIGDSFVLGYVGVLREWIDLESVFGALVDLRDTGCSAKLLVLGEEGGLQEPRTLANRYGVSDMVIFTGTVPYSKVPRYLSCMNVGLVPFKINRVAIGALPLKLLEYMACGLPVLCTRLPGIENAVEDRVLYASNRDEIVGAVRLLHERPAMRGKLGVEGNKFVEENYTWERIVSQLESILDEIVAHDDSQVEVDR
jgi:glycosyltransferase involved in cell wall biosynthesis